MSSVQDSWPFEGPKNQACFVSAHILAGDKIQHVYHDWEDGSWQFLPDRVTAPEDYRLVCLESVFRLDPSIGELANMDEGWRACREADDVWHRHLNHPYPTFSTHGYYLIPVALCLEGYPETPTETERLDLKEGQFVKLAFRFSPEEAASKDHDIERMWVQVRSQDCELGCYQGSLDNDPKFNAGISSGDTIVFNQLHVLRILID